MATKASIKYLPKLNLKTLEPDRSAAVRNFAVESVTPGRIECELRRGIIRAANSAKTGFAEDRQSMWMEMGRRRKDSMKAFSSNGPGYPLDL